VKLLVLSPFPPRGDAPHGGARWIAGIVASLAASHRVGLLALRGPGEDEIDPEVAEMCEFAIEVERRTARTSLVCMWQERQRVAMAAGGAPGWAVGYSVRALAAELERVVAEWQPDLVHVESVVMAQYADKLAGLPLVVVDQDAAEGSRAMQRFRARVLPRADAVVAFTERDRAAIAAIAPAARVECIPLAVDVPHAPLDPSGNGRDVLFVGNFMHPPNGEAAERLAGAIFPRVAAERPDARLVLVGADPPASVLAHASDRVVVAGRVDDLRPLLDAAAVVVAPIASGGGMRVKSLDALAAGKALVASPLALEGIEVHAGAEVLVATDDASFAAAIVALLEDEPLRTALGSAARVWAATHVAWQPVTAAYEALYASLLERGRSVS
jgi:glycosyltransferase involved in cell wall biosynthesis